MFWKYLACVAFSITVMCVVHYFFKCGLENFLASRRMHRGIRKQQKVWYGK